MISAETSMNRFVPTMLIWKLLICVRINIMLSHVSLLDRLYFKSEILLIHPEKPRSESLSASVGSKEPISSLLLQAAL